MSFFLNHLSVSNIYHTLYYRGVQVNTNVTPAFDPKAVKSLSTRIYDSRDELKHVFVSIDPAAGGTGSKYAIVSCVYVNRSKMVVSLLPFLHVFSSFSWCIFQVK